jgi:hypothetical protein
MGIDRADFVVALQEALMHAARDFGEIEGFRAHTPRVLATAAALDYVLMLARGAAGTRIVERDAERAIHEGIVRAVDDLIFAANVIAEERTGASTAFAHAAAKTLRDVLRAEGLRTDQRAFALIALANT